MRGHHYLVQFQEVQAPRRFGGEHVEGRPGNPAERDGFGQGRLVDDPTPGGVDEPQAGFGVDQKFLPDQAGRLCRLGDMDGQEIGLADQVLEGDQLSAHSPGPIGRQIRVVGHEAHPERQRPLRHQGADPAQTDDPEGLAVQFHAFPTRAFPAARFQRGVGLRDVAGLGQQQGDGVLGGREDVRLRGVHHDDPASRGRGDVDIVEADPRPAHHLQLTTGGQHLVVDVGGRTDDERRRARDSLEEVPVRQAEPDIDMVARLSQEVEAGLGDFFGYQDAGHGGHGPTKGLGGPVTWRRLRSSRP